VREDKKPNIPVPPTVVSLNRQLFPNAEMAIGDLAGAVWIGPAASTAVTSQNVQSWVFTPWGLPVRNEVQMLFVYGEKDARGKQAARTFFSNTLKLDGKTGPGGQQLPKPLFSTSREIKGSGNAGSKLLGNNLGTETMLVDFLEAVDKDRKGKPRKTREWTKPLYVDVQSFGLMR
jgi:hypothetical protein